MHLYFVEFSKEPVLVKTEFSEEKTQRYITQVLGPKDKQGFMNQAENSGIKELLAIPIAVVRSCSLYKQRKTLPNKTELIEMIVHETIDKELSKYELEVTHDNIEKLALLAKLGKLSWQALQKSSEQLYIKKVRSVCL